MSNSKKYLVLFFSLISIYTFTYAGDESFMMPGEYLEYNVSFIGVSLGTIKIQVDSITKVNNNEAYKITAYINSNPSIPFVSISSKYESWLDKSLAYSHLFIGSSKFLKDEWDYQKIQFKYDKKQLINEMWTGGVKQYMDTLNIQKKYNEGFTLFYFARRFLTSKRNIIIPTIIQKDTTTTQINFLNKSEAVEIDKVDYKIKTKYFNGVANWEGVYGLNGKFEGWFSDDEDRVPIKAKMNVIVGNVWIELVKWNRKGWKPPKY